MRESDLTTFRQNLTSAIDALHTEGPLRLTHYGHTVAEIRSTQPDAERAYTRSVIDTVRYLSEMEILDPLIDRGIDTLNALTEVVLRQQELGRNGATFSPYPDEAIPDTGTLTVDEALAYLYFGGDSYPKNANNPYEWFIACTELQRAAKDRGVSSNLPQPSAYSDDKPTFVDMAISSGHTPRSLVSFGLNALDQGVAIESLADMLGENPVPADVLALPHYHESWLNQLVELDLPRAEAVKVFRSNLDLDLVNKFICAGVRTADELADLIGNGVNPDLALRASYEGITPDQWKVQVPAIQPHLRYKATGHLPFDLLVRAAKEGVSLVRWDDANFAVDAGAHGDEGYAGTEIYPWKCIYPDRVIDVARLNIPVGFVRSYAKVVQGHYGDNTAGFVDDMIRVRSHGPISIGVLRVLEKSGVGFLTPDRLIKLMDAGLHGELQALYLTKNVVSDYDEWICQLNNRRNLMDLAKEFHTELRDSNIWEALHAGATVLKRIYDSRSRHDNTYFVKTLDLFLLDKELNDVQIADVLRNVGSLYVHKDSLSRRYGHYLPESWIEYSRRGNDICDLADDFVDRCRDEGAREAD